MADSLTNPVLSNAVASNASVLWQYDHAPNLLGLLKGLNGIADATTAKFWDYFRDGVFDIDHADTFGLNVWGRLLGLPRPVVSIPVRDSSGYQTATFVPTPITDGFFRRLLKARQYILRAAPTVYDYNKYLDMAFGIGLSADSFPIRYSENGNARQISLAGEDCEYGIHGGALHTGSIALYAKTAEGSICVAAFDPVTFVFVGEGEDIDEGSLTFNGEIPEAGISPVLSANVGGFSRECRVIDPGDMALGFTFPMSATDEEAYMFFQHYDELFPFPAGTRSRSSFSMSDRVIGFEGQSLRDFADAFAWADDQTAEGGILSGTPRANYFEPTAVLPDGASPYAVAKALVFSANAGVTYSVVGSGGADFPADGISCVDWGDGTMECRKSSGTFTHSYASGGRYAVALYLTGDGGIYDEDGQQVAADTYLLQ